MSGTACISECPGEDLLLAYGQGDLSQSVVQRVEEHLAQCADCRELCAYAISGVVDTGPLGPDAPQPPGYVRESILGTGATGTVYAARRADDGRLVALRLVDPKLVGDQPLRRLLRRARRLLSVRRHGLAQYLDCGIFEGQVFLVRELVRGEHPQPSCGSWRQAVATLRELAVTLRALHRLGYVHGRLGRSDVWLCERGGITLTDFGLFGMTRGTASARHFERAVDMDRAAFCRIARTVLEPMRPPARLLRALRRGEELDAETPYRSIAELVDRLDRATKRSMAARVMPGAALVLAAACMLSDTPAASATADCSAPVVHWDSKQRQTLRDAFLSADDPSAELLAKHTELRLDQYVQDAMASAEAACSAAVEPAPETIACQAAHVATANSLIAELSQSPSPRDVRNALAAIQSLPDTTDCSVARPRTARVLAALGQWDEAEAAARNDVAVTSALDSDAHALALVDLALVMGHRRANEATELLREAYARASASDSARGRWESALGLLRVHVEHGNKVEIRAWSATVERLSDERTRFDPSVADALETLARAHVLLDETEAAIRSLRRAQALLVRHERDDTTLARVRDQLARLLVDTGKLEEAEKLAAKAWSARMRHLGPDHPEVARSHRTMALLAESRSMPYAAKHHTEAATQLLAALRGLDAREAEG